jgi:hypothetical protein
MLANGYKEGKFGSDPEEVARIKMSYSWVVFSLDPLPGGECWESYRRELRGEEGHVKSLSAPQFFSEDSSPAGRAIYLLLPRNPFLLTASPPVVSNFYHTAILSNFSSWKVRDNDPETMFPILDTAFDIGVDGRYRPSYNRGSVRGLFMVLGGEICCCSSARRKN